MTTVLILGGRSLESFSSWSHTNDFVRDSRLKVKVLEECGVNGRPKEDTDEHTSP